MIAELKCAVLHTRETETKNGRIYIVTEIHKQK